MLGFWKFKEQMGDVSTESDCGDMGGDTGQLSTTQTSNDSYECGPVQSLNSCFLHTINEHLLKE